MIALVSFHALACVPESEPSPESGDSASRPELVASEAGRYLVALEPAEGAAPLGRIHEWLLRVELPDGSVVAPTRVEVSGGMPQHDHGFITRPRYAGPAPDGRLRIEGVKFHMPGEWTFQFEIVGPEGPDVATFVVDVQP